MSRFCWRCAAVLTGPPPTVCGACGQAHYANPKPAGEAVVINNGEVLLLRRAAEPYRDAWDVPGGFCDADEHPMHAAERELSEELGLAGQAIAYVGTWMDTYGPPDPDGVQVHTVTSAYLVAVFDPAAAVRLQPGEALEARWFPLDQLPGGLAFPGHAFAMLRAAADIVAGTGRPLPDRVW
jgi:8-oxo-dGTP diphosphatase